jgi:hypothetical protein
VILHALPVREPERLVLVDWNGDDLITGAIGSFNLMPYPICRDLQQQTRFLDGVLCRAEIQVNLTVGGDPRPVAAEIVSGSYFPVLGVGPALGRDNPIASRVFSNPCWMSISSLVVTRC